MFSDCKRHAKNMRYIGNIFNEISYWSIRHSRQSLDCSRHLELSKLLSLRHFMNVSLKTLHSPEITVGHNQPEEQSRVFDSVIPDSETIWSHKHYAFFFFFLNVIKKIVTRAESFGIHKYNLQLVCWHSALCFHTDW